jgi:uncharacterized protein YndB with AHSA1/START domain
MEAVLARWVDHRPSSIRPVRHGCQRGGRAGGQNVLMTATVSVTREIAAPADHVWKLVSDLTRMGEWSPENTGGKWTHGATGPAVGARFKGTNANGRKRRSISAVVTRCDPGVCLEFAVSAAGLSIARWTYDLEPAGSGCRVTETFTDARGRIAKAFGGPASGVTDRPNHNRAGMEHTLANLATVAEAASS